MKTIQINLYEFKELSEKSKEKAVYSLYDLNINYDWWDSVYKDAENVGIKIKGFSLSGNNYISVEISDVRSTILKIMKNHGNKCDTHIAARAYSDTQTRILDYLKKHVFTEAIKKTYFKMLRDEYRHRTSDDAIIETIKVNEYYFTDNGELYNLSGI